MPNDVGGTGRLRNVIDDPFCCRGNRETAGMEWLFSYDLRQELGCMNGIMTGQKMLHLL